MLEIVGLEKYYGKIKALDRISLQIQDGEILGIIGQNGAGKTTLLKVIAGLLDPDKGSVILDGVDLRKQPDQTGLQIGYVPDSYQLYDHLTVMEYLEFYAGLYQLEQKKQKAWMKELLSLVSLSDAADIFVENLSSGMRQKLCVARALLPNPKILVLDEPANGLDPKARIEFRELLRNLSASEKTIIVSSHMVSGLPDYCTSMGILEHGNLILEGSIEEIMIEIKKNQPLLIQVLGMEEKALSVLKSDKNVKKISLDGHCFTVYFEGTEEEEASLLSCLLQNQVPVQSFYKASGDLESSFLELIS